MRKILNVGCGNKIIQGAINIDNSKSVIISRNIFLFFLLKNFISKESLSFIDFLRKNKVVYGSCTKLPFENDSVELVYSCHMCEHLYRDELLKFINESYRVLKKGGVLRIVIPDLSILIDEYTKEKDADRFLQSLYFQDCREKLNLLNKIKFLIYGNRLHKWMYNGTSFKNLVESNSQFKGFILKAGESKLDKDLAKVIDLNERENESVYFEFFK